jgi:hypothetical protein
MTNELEYYGRPEPYGRTFERTRQPEPIQLSPGEKVAFYKLFEGDAMRLAKVRGLRAGASFLALAVHAGRTSSNGSTCFPKVTTAAELTGQSTRATSGHFRGLGDDGFIQARRRRRTSSVYTVAHSDSSKQRYAQISKPWLEAHRGAGASALFLLAVLLAMAGPRRTFPRRLNDLLAALDVSRATFYRLAGELKRRGWLDWDCADGLITLTMLENPVSETTVLPVSKTAVLAVSKTAHEVDKNLEVARSSEEARSTPKSKPTQDQRSAENRAHAAAAITSLSLSREDQQQAMTLAMIYPEPEKGGRGKTSAAKTAAKRGGFSGDRVDVARTVLKLAQQYDAMKIVGAVQVGDLGLHHVQDHHVDHHVQDHDQKPELDAPIERMLAKLGIKLTPPPEPEPKPKSAVQLLRERGWIITSDDGWACAEKPGEHNCDGGYILAPDGRGHKSMLRCKVCFDAERQAQPVEQAEPATRSGGFNVMEMSSDIFREMIAAASRPRLPAFVPLQLPGPRTIEAEEPPRRQSRAKALPPLTPEEFADCWAIIRNRCRGLVIRGQPLESRCVNGLLKLAKDEGFLRRDVDLDDFDVFLREFADAHVQRRGVSITDKQVSGLVSDALREVLGHDDDSGNMLGRMGPESDFPGCPRAVYARTHGGVM